MIISINYGHAPDRVRRTARRLGFTEVGRNRWQVPDDLPEVYDGPGSRVEAGEKRELIQAQIALSECGYSVGVTEVDE